MFFTSGTTGHPKMTQLSCASYGLGHAITAKYWMDLCPTDVHWNLADPGWAKSAYSNVFGPWINGACVFIHAMPRIDPPLVLQVHASNSIVICTQHSTSKPHDSHTLQTVSSLITDCLNTSDRRPRSHVNASVYSLCQDKQARD